MIDFAKPAPQRIGGTERDREREARVVAALAAGGVDPTFDTVGAKEKISRERVRQIVERWERETGNRIPRAPERRRQAKQEARLARQAAREDKKRLTPSLAQRLLANVRPVPATDCWEWIGPISDTGGGCYPRFNALGEQFAHRVSYRLWIGEIPDDHYVRQSCSGRFCVNPFHLYTIHRGDAARRWTTGRRRLQPRTHCRRGHELTDENVVWNTTSTRRAGSWVRVKTRLCRTCAEDRHRRHYQPRPPLPEDPHERAVERSIRRIETARVADRRAVLRRELRGHLRTDVPALAAEQWTDYLARTGENGSFEDWLASRLIRDPRVTRAVDARGRMKRTASAGVASRKAG